MKIRWYTTSNLVNLAFIIGALAFAVSTGLSYFNIQKNNAQAYWVTHTYQVLLTSERLATSVSELEAQVRGYAITRNESFLNRFNEIKSTPLVIYDTLAAKTQDNAAQRQLMPLLKLCVEAKLRHVDSSIRAVTLGQNVLVDHYLLRSNMAMNALQSKLRNVNKLENALMEVRTARYQATVRDNTLYEALGLVIGMGIILFGYMLGKAQRKALDESLTEINQANDKLAFANANLERTVAERTNKLNITLLELSTELQRKNREVEDASRFLNSILPTIELPIDIWEVDARTWPADDVGGDYYDYKLDEANTCLTLTLGDAAGHGLMAAMIVSNVHSYWQTFAAQEPAQQLLKRISTGLLNLKLRGAFMALAVITLERGRLEITSAGMPPFMIYRKRQKDIETVTIRSLFLGSAFYDQYETYQFDLEMGDVLLAYTDGILEARNGAGEFFGLERIRESFNKFAGLPAKQIIDHLNGCMSDWTGNNAQDDASFMVVRMKTAA